MGQDTKRIVVAMVIMLGVVVGWEQFVRWKWPEYYAQKNQPQPTEQNVAPAPPATTRSATTTGATTRPQGTPSAVTTAPAPVAGQWRARGAGTAAAGAQLGSGAKDDAKFVMELNVSGRGAGLDSVVLNQFRAAAQDPVKRYVFQEPLSQNGLPREDARSLGTRSVLVDGHEVDLANVTWKLVSSAADSATFSVDILDGETAVARVVKTYRLAPRSDDKNTSQGYEVTLVQRVENLSDKPIDVRSVLNGPTPPPRELEGQPDQNLIFGYTSDQIIKVFSHAIASEFGKDHAWKEYTKSDKGWPMLWAGTQSAYFNAIVRPVPAGKDQPAAAWVTKTSAELLNPGETNHDLFQVVMRLETDTQRVEPKQAAERTFEAYFGPKGRGVLNTAYYTAFPREYSQTLVISGGFCGFCTWQWLINILVWMLTAFHVVTRDWGLAIIGLVLVVRALLHPITKKSQVHMVKMQKMGPEMEKLKKKYADDKDALARAQMQFYKEQGMTPVLGCLPMFLQMPIWIALWNSLQSTFELRHSPFLYGLTWIHDLSKPDYLVKFNEPVHLLFGLTMRGINVLPILMGVVMYFQTKLTPKPAALTPEQEQQQKMMTWMSTLLFPLMLYTGPAGLNLYIMTSTGFGIIESKVIRKHIKEREALEAASGPTIVDEPPEPKGGGGKKGGKGPKEPEKPKGWLARLQERAEQIRDEAQKRPKR